MSISEKLKKAKKALVAGALTIAAVAAPIKGQSAEATPEKEPAKTVQMTKAQKERQQLFEAAVRAGAPKEEIAKYIDFPEFIPVAKDGKFDQKKADEWAKKLAPYMKTLAEKGETVSAAEAYKAFKEATGQTNVSLEDFERVCKMTQEALTKNKEKKSDIPMHLFMVPLFAAVAYGLGKLTRSAAREGMEDARAREIGNAIINLCGASASAFLSLSTALGVVVGAYGFVDALKSTPERAVSQIYSHMYDTHVDNTIKAQQKQFHQLEWAQAKKVIETAQDRK